MGTYNFAKSAQKRSTPSALPSLSGFKEREREREQLHGILTLISMIEIGPFNLDERPSTGVVVVSSERRSSRRQRKSGPSRANSLDSSSDHSTISVSLHKKSSKDKRRRRRTRAQVSFDPQKPLVIGSRDCSDNLWFTKAQIDGFRLERQKQFTSRELDWTKARQSLIRLQEEASLAMEDSTHTPLDAELELYNQEPELNNHVTLFGLETQLLDQNRLRSQRRAALYRAVCYQEDLSSEEIAARSMKISFKGCRLAKSIAMSQAQHVL